MMMKLLTSLLWMVAAASAERTVDVTAVNYTDVDGFALQGFVSNNNNNNEAADALRPVVVIIHDASGINAYEQQRATLLNEIGYVGFAADIFGEHDIVDRDRRRELLTLYRGNVTLFVQRIKAAVNVAKTLEGVDPTKVAIIGYCFGGTGVLTYGLTGQDDVQALVSFHGGLLLPEIGPELVPQLLVLSGGEDDTATEIMDLEDTLKSVNGTWEITRYSGIQHAFTVFDDNRYNQWADARSWQEMSTFLQKVFGEVVVTTTTMDDTMDDSNMMMDYVAPSGYVNNYMGEPPDMIDVVAMNYTDIDGTALTGYLAKPDMNAAAATPTPTVVIIPDWDGVNKYEKERATLLAQNGYIAFAADIYGSDLQENLDFLTRIDQANKYRDDPALFVQRIQLAVDMVKAMTDDVDTDNIALVGYCFGGTGVIEYAFGGSNTDAKAVVSFHGGHRELPQPMMNITPYVLVLSGGIDDAHGNQTLMEEAFDARNASWEISRYSMVDHGYTDWDSPLYNQEADIRSWESMMSVFASVMPVDGKVIAIDTPQFVSDVDTTETPETAVPETAAPETAVPATGSPVEPVTSAPVAEGGGTLEPKPAPTPSPDSSGSMALLNTPVSSLMLLLTASLLVCIH